ncbi:hypothetical protein NLN78_23515, partial [Citrobacter portucalensis]|nr:hypothetical protein [Citrobacter portucalensis]
MIYDRLVNPKILEWALPDCLLINVGKNPGFHCVPQDEINALEDFLNTALFNHAKKRIFLNAAGKHYLSIVKETLNKLERD